MADQRKIKFKTLDNTITEMTVLHDISILNLKKQIAEKLGMSIESQRLIYKGKQLKDDQKLSDHITKDDEIIHLMSRVAQTNTSTTTGTSTSVPNTGTGTIGTGPNIQSGGFTLNLGGGGISNMIGNLLSNPNAMMQMTNLIFGGEQPGQQPTGNPNANPPQVNLNDMLQNILNPPINVPTQNTNPNLQTSSSTSSVPSSNIPRSDNDPRYDSLLKGPKESIAHLTSLNSRLSGVDSRNENQNMLDRIPPLSTAANVTTSIGRIMRNYYNVLQGFLPFVLKLSDLMERESLITNVEERKKVQELIKACSEGFEEIAKSANSLNTMLSGLEYGASPSTGYLRIVAGGVQIVEAQVPTLSSTAQTQTTSSVNNPPENSAQITTSKPTTQQTEKKTDTVSKPTSSSVPSQAPTQTAEQPIIASNKCSQSQTTTSQTTKPPSTQAQPKPQSANPMANIFSEMSKPENMQTMMNMASELMRGGRGGNSNQGNAGQFNNLLSQLLQGLGSDEDEGEEEKGKESRHQGESQTEEIDTIQHVNNILNDTSSRRSTHLHDLVTHLQINPCPEFKEFSEKVVYNLSMQDILDLQRLNLIAITRQRKILKELLSKCLQGSDISRIADYLSEIVSEKMIVIENDIDKFMNTSFTVMPYLTQFFNSIIPIIINDSLTDMNWEMHIRRYLLSSIGQLFEELVKSYASHKEGALYYFDYNVENILAGLIGKTAVEQMKKINEKAIWQFIDNVLDIWETEKNKIIPEESLLKEKEKKSENSNIRIELNLSTDKILEIAQKDKTRFDMNPVQFSKNYFKASLFQE